MKNYILNKLKEYSAIESPSGNESFFCNYLEKDFRKDVQETDGIFSRKVYYDENIFYSFIRFDPDSKIFFSVHTDRIGNFTNTIKEFDPDVITGQLDNIISIAVLRYLLSKGLRFNVLFTTKEELSLSWPQLKELISVNTDFFPVSLDIDVMEYLSENAGNISLRMNDEVGCYDSEIVMKMRDLAISNNIEYIDETVGWAAVEAGFLQNGCGLKGVHIGIPISNYHTDYEICHWKTIENAVKYLELLISNQNRIFPEFRKQRRNLRRSAKRSKVSQD